MKPLLSLDFDGVIHAYDSGWKGPRCIPDGPVPGAMSFLEEAVKHFHVAIYSSRSQYWFARRAMKQWLLRELETHFGKLCPSYATTEDPLRPGQSIAFSFARDIVENIQFPTEKPPAHLQIDDRAMTFTGKFPAMTDIKNFRPWNKKRQ